MGSIIFMIFWLVGIYVGPIVEEKMHGKFGLTKVPWGYMFTGTMCSFGTIFLAALKK